MAIDAELAGYGTTRKPGGIGAVLRIVRQALKRRQAETEIGALSDRYLRDIGVERSQISERVAREIGRVSLAEVGWPRRPHRR